MYMKTCLGMILFTLITAGSHSVAADAHRHVSNAAKAGEFDYYKLVFSRDREWCYAKGLSVAKCASEPEYVIHGLWPEYTNGHPEDCKESSAPSMEVIDPVIDAEIAKIVPGQIMEHEWRTHGRCSGLSRTAYFSEIIRLSQAVKLPNLQRATYAVADIKLMIAKSNGELKSKNIQLACHENSRFKLANANTLDEIRICYRKDLKGFEQCSGESDQCPSELKVRY